MRTLIAVIVLFIALAYVHPYLAVAYSMVLGAACIYYALRPKRKALPAPTREALRLCNHSNRKALAHDRRAHS